MQLQKRARTLDDRRGKQALAACRNSRERLILSLSMYAGLRSVEIAGLRWGHVDASHLLLKTTKGKQPRNIPMSTALKAALAEYRITRAGKDAPEDYVLVNTQAHPGEPLTPNAVAQWFRHFYVERLGWEGYSSHSGRRTFATSIARNLGRVGGSIQDLRALMGHEWITTTQRYIDQNEEAQVDLVNLL